MKLLLTSGGVSRKHDHDQVNDVNASVFKGIAAYYAAHYDPFFDSVNQTYPLDRAFMVVATQAWPRACWSAASPPATSERSSARTSSGSWSNPSTAVGRNNQDDSSR